MTLSNNPSKCEWGDCKESIYSTDEGRCILHSRIQEKDPTQFLGRIKKKLNANDCNFSGTYFPDDIYFDNHVLRKADFYAAEFKGLVRFVNCQFEGNASFIQTTFQGAGVFFNATFLNTADFTNARFSGLGNFSGAKFQGNTDFTGASFDDIANFDQARLNGSAIFVQATFNKGASFHRCYFASVANFTMTSFAGRQEFQYLLPLKQRFTGAASFVETVFGDKTYFVGNSFQEPVDFALAQFSHAAIFSSRLIALGAYQNQQKVTAEKEKQSPQQEIQKLKNLQANKLGPDLCLEDVFFERPELVRFEDFDLRRSTVTGTNLRRVYFHNVRWPRRGSRLVLYDEIRTPSLDLSKREALRLLYRDLKANAEDSRDYDVAGDFYYAELDLARRYHASLLRRVMLSAFCLAAGYAERPMRAFLFFVLLVVLFTYLLNHPAAIFSTEETKVVLLSPIEAFAHSVRAVFLRPFFFQPESKYANLVSLLANIAGPLQLAFLFISLRRRFKR